MKHLIKLILIAIYLILFGSQVAYADSDLEDYRVADYRVALTAAKKLVLKKSEFETWDDFAKRVLVDCQSTASPLCRPVKFVENLRFARYSPEHEDFSIFVLSSGRFSGSDMDQFQSSKYVPMCSMEREISSKTSTYMGENAFGVRTRVTKYITQLDGVAFEANVPLPDGWASGTPSSFTHLECYDKMQFVRPNQFPSDAQYLKVSKEDAKKESGKIQVELIGMPRSPYLLRLQRHISPTLDEPSESQDFYTALEINPIELRFVGSVTKKVYAQFKYPGFASDSSSKP